MFRELQPPYEGGRGWFIATQDDESGWLTINGIIESSTFPLEDYYFTSEEDAHKAADEYYRINNQVYLHDATLDDDEDEDDKPQVMEFI